MPPKPTLTFKQARTLFPHTKKLIYFGAASSGPMNVWAREAITDYFDTRTDLAKDDTKMFFSNLDQLRGEYALLIGATKNEIGVGMSASFGMNIAGFGLPLKEGDEVLLSDVEFPAAVYAWRGAAEARGLKLRFLASVNREFSLVVLERAITERTRVLCLSWVQYFNGFKNDLRAISAICKKHNIWFIVDGTQGMGAEYINIKKAGVDMFAESCQKWMLSPQGCGFFYIRKEIQEIIIPPAMSWQSAEWHQDFTDMFRYDLPYANSASRFECGYYVVSNIIGMRQANRLFLGLGIRNIERHNHALIDRLVAYLKGNTFYHITSSLIPRHRSSIFAFSCENPMALHRELLTKKIMQVVREGSIRVSPHLYNDNSDIDALIDALDTYSRKGARVATSTVKKSARKR
jgi:cysteine desulfurase / selenocysteine lyase